MEFPHLGKPCSEETCKLLDFLPMKCDACGSIFCKDHFLYLKHNCPASYQKNVQVPICPICNQAVPVGKGELPDDKVGQHIDRDCKYFPSDKKKIYTNRCSSSGCKQKEMIPLLCELCRKNFCLKHRHAQDHQCTGSPIKSSSTAVANAGAAALARFQDFRSSICRESRTTEAVGAHQMQSKLAAVQGSLDEDEALARALQMSLMETTSPQNDLPTVSPYNTRQQLRRERQDSGCILS